MVKICKFGGREHPFSNFYPAPTTYEGRVYSTSEGDGKMVGRWLKPRSDLGAGQISNYGRDYMRLA